MKKCWQTSSSPSVNMDFMFQDPGYIQNKIRGFSHFLLHIYAKTHQRKHIENKNWSRLKPPKTCIGSWSVNLRSHCRIHFRKSESVKIKVNIQDQRHGRKSLRDEKACILSKVQNARYPLLPNPQVACMYVSLLIYLDLHTQLGKSKKYSPKWWFHGDFPW